MKILKTILIAFFLCQFLSMMLAETQKEFKSKLLEFIKNESSKGNYDYAIGLRGRWTLLLDLINEHPELLDKYLHPE